MTSNISFPADDRDFDDAALWAVIDSAEASSLKSRRSQTLSITYSGPRSSSPPLKSSHNSNKHIRTNATTSPLPRKVPRICESEFSDSNRSLVLKPVSKTLSYSPESHLSPEIVKSDILKFDQRFPETENPNGIFPSISLFKDYMKAAMAILEKTDYTMVSGNPYIKKSGWRKISFYFNISYEITDKAIEFDENRNVQRAEFVVRAHMKGGRFSDGWGSCERREKRFMKPNHDIPSTAETRAKNRSCQDLLGIGAAQIHD